MEEKGGEVARLTKVRRDSRDDKADDCPVCLTAFDDAMQRPRTLPCGHTLCTPCINGLKEQGHVTCPICRVAHAVPEAGQFPVSYTVEALVRKLKSAASAFPPPGPGKDTGEPAPSSVIGPGQKEPAGLSKAIRSMIQEQEDKVLAAIRTCQEIQLQLDQYQTTLAGWGEQQQQLEDRLQTLMDKSKNARVLLRKEESHVTVKKEEMQHGEQQLHAQLEVLRSVATGLEAYKAIDDADHCTEKEKERTEECRKMLPNVHTVTTIRKVMVTSRAALKAVQAVEEALDTKGVPDCAVKDPSFPTDPAYTITERLQDLLALTLDAEDLRSMTKPVRSLLEAGRVFAAHEVKGHSCQARISLEDGCLYLHSLRDRPLPLGAAIVQVDEVVPSSPPWLVFLDLVWPGTERRRVLVRLSSDTQLARQFVLLCTGQQGPCYANTKLFKVGDKGEPGEYVMGGDYDKNDGTGGAALLHDCDKSGYFKSGSAGSVIQVIRGSNKSDWNALFAICTRDKKKDNVFSTVFGKVEAGLDALAAAAQHNPITKVTVVECGVVL